MKKQKNVCEKYGINRNELKKAVEQYSSLATGRFTGNTMCLVAIIDLLCNGDIDEDKKENRPAGTHGAARSN